MHAPRPLARIAPTFVCPHAMNEANQQKKKNKKKNDEENANYYASSGCRRFQETRAMFLLVFSGFVFWCSLFYAFFAIFAQFVGHFADLWALLRFMSLK